MDRSSPEGPRVRGETAEAASARHRPPSFARPPRPEHHGVRADRPGPDDVRLRWGRPAQRLQQWGPDRRDAAQAPGFGRGDQPLRYHRPLPAVVASCGQDLGTRMYGVASGTPPVRKPFDDQVLVLGLARQPFGWGPRSRARGRRQGQWSARVGASAHRPNGTEPLARESPPDTRSPGSSRGEAQEVTGRARLCRRVQARHEDIQQSGPVPVPCGPLRQDPRGRDQPVSALDRARCGLPIMPARTGPRPR